MDGGEPRWDTNAASPMVGVMHAGIACATIMEQAPPLWNIDSFQAQWKGIPEWSA